MFGGALWVPTIVDAQIDRPTQQVADPSDGGIVPCQGTAEDPCTFSDFIELIQNFINWLIFIAVPLSAVIFTFAGLKYITAAGDPGKIKSAHGIFKNVAIGLLFVLGAWLIVYTITSTLLDPDRGAGAQFLE